MILSLDHAKCLHVTTQRPTAFALLATGYLLWSYAQASGNCIHVTSRYHGSKTHQRWFICAGLGEPVECRLAAFHIKVKLHFTEVHPPCIFVAL
jgi:hypothetical protein